MNLKSWFLGQLSPPPMRLRCKPGDIARIVDDQKNQDRLVHVDSPALDEPGRWNVTGLQSLWCYSTKRMYPAGSHGMCTDSKLRPLRDSPGEDETLAWAGKPKTEPAKPALPVDLKVRA